MQSTDSRFCTFTPLPCPRVQIISRALKLFGGPLCRLGGKGPRPPPTFPALQSEQVAVVLQGLDDDMHKVKLALEGEEENMERQQSPWTGREPAPGGAQNGTRHGGSPQLSVSRQLDPTESIPEPGWGHSPARAAHPGDRS